MSSYRRVFPDILDFICHTHFLRDIGKDLMEEEYSTIRNRLKTHRIRSLLREKAKTFKKLVDENDEVIGDL